MAVTSTDHHPTGWRRAWLLAKREKLTLVGAGIVTFFILLAIVGPWLGAEQADTVNMDQMLEPPSSRHWFGTDAVGRDVLARTAVATRVDLLVALGAVSLSLMIGSVLGMLAGYVGGWVDELVMRLLDVLQAFPAFVLALAVVAALGQGPANIMVVIAFINVPSYARLMRTEFLSARERQYAAAALVLGYSHSRIVFRHLFPNCITPVLVIASLNVGWAVLTTAGLSFLGIGIKPPAPEWGQMIAAGLEDLVGGIWWTSVFPGLMLLVMVLGWNFLGDGMQQLLNPRAESSGG